METTIILFDEIRCENKPIIIETNLTHLPRAGEYLTYQGKDHYICKVSYLLLDQKDNPLNNIEQVAKITAYQIEKEPVNPMITPNDAQTH